MTVESLQDLFLEALKDLYYVEKTLVKKLPKIATLASSSDLRDAINQHLQETEGHVERLDQVFEMIGRKATAKKCDALDGLLKEAESVTGEIEDPQTRDAAIISSAQAVEHYEIARYGTLACWAEDVSNDDVRDLLQATLDEETAADQKLSAIAVSSINQSAAA
jgi:ferritin-like metal-binding protein YciE